MQAGDGDALIRGDLADLVSPRGWQQMRFRRQREGRNLQPVIAKVFGEIALPREIEFGQHFVAQEKFSCNLYAPLDLPRKLPIALLQARLTAFVTVAMFIRIVPATRQNSTKLIGRSEERREVTVGQCETTPQILVEQVAQHDTQNERGHRIIELAQEEADDAESQHHIDIEEARCDAALSRRTISPALRLNRFGPDGQHPTRGRVSG